jgi:hypothetical protein
MRITSTDILSLASVTSDKALYREGRDEVHLLALDPLSPGATAVLKRFAVDFAGESTVRVSLAATGVTLGPGGESAPQRFAVCVRNMFEEERGGNPGVLEVTVTPPAGEGAGEGAERDPWAFRGVAQPDAGPPQRPGPRRFFSILLRCPSPRFPSHCRDVPREFRRTFEAAVVPDVRNCRRDATLLTLKVCYLVAYR